MDDPPHHPGFKGNAGDDTGVERDGGSTASTPRWVRVFGIIAIVLVLLFVIMLITRGPHGS